MGAAGQKRRGLALAVAACTVAATGAALTVPGAGAAAGAGSSAVTGAGSGASVGPAPNVVLFLLDDLGYADTGITRANHRNPRGSTPTLDRLSREGVVFTDATASPNCTPTRASLLTGTQGTDPENRIFAVNGLNFGRRGVLLKGPHQGQPNQAEGHEALPRSAVTIAETMQAGGYATAAFGKFHVAQTRPQVVDWHGFDVSYGSASAGHPGSYTADKRGRFNPMVQGGLDRFGARYTRAYVKQHIAPFSRGVSRSALRSVVGTRKNVQDAMADATDLFISQQAQGTGSPFFLHIGSFAVHRPINAAQARVDLARKYRARASAPTRQRKVRRAYDAVLEGADQTVARLVNALQTTPDPRNHGRPMADNTIVFFTSDNGGDLRYGADNGRFTAGKSTTWEGGVRVPWLVWSGNKKLVPAGGTRHQQINATDFYPTVVQATGVPNTQRQLDGVSWWPAVRSPRYQLLAGRDLARHARVVHLPGYMGRNGSAPVTSVRQGRWKATFAYESGTWALYDVRRDPGERHDVARTHSAVVGRLARLTLAWAKVHRPPLATLKRARTVLVRTRFTGTIYANGRARKVRRATVRLVRGQAAPLLVPARFGSQRSYRVTRR